MLQPITFSLPLRSFINNKAHTVNFFQKLKSIDLKRQRREVGLPQTRAGESQPLLIEFEFTKYLQVELEFKFSIFDFASSSLSSSSAVFTDFIPSLSCFFRLRLCSGDFCKV